jgi:ribosomal protein L7Ae-like RNA K-turn-binding protein
MSQKCIQLLGLASRARKIATGEDLVLTEVKSKRAKIVFLANDASANTEKKMTDKCTYYGIQVFRNFDRETLGKAIGKETRVSLAVLDAGFAKKMIQILQEDKMIEN